jgi:hypothetical protein
VLLTMIASTLLAAPAPKPAPKPPPPPKWSDLKELGFPDEETCRKQYFVWGSNCQKFYPKDENGKPIRPKADNPHHLENYALVYWSYVGSIWSVIPKNREEAMKDLHKFLGEKAYRKGWHPPIWDGKKAIPQFEFPNKKWFDDNGGGKKHD